MIDAYTHETIDADDLVTEKTEAHFTLEELQKSWMSKMENNCVFISALHKENLEDFMNSKNASGKTIEETRLELVSKIGENVKIRRIKSIDGKDSYLGHYMHGSKIGVVVTLEKENDELAKDICMHVAAMKPSALNANDISKNDLEKEREIYMAQAKESGKPENLIQKMVDGKIKK